MKIETATFQTATFQTSQNDNKKYTTFNKATLQ